eukprot:gene9105-10677_t
MADVTENFSAMQFWKAVEKKNTSFSYGGAKDVGNPAAPKKLGFPLLKPPPAPEEEATAVLAKNEWEEQNATKAFDFWKKKAIEIKEESDRYTSRRGVRSTVDLTGLLAKTASQESLLSPDSGSARGDGSTDNNNNNNDNQQEEDQVNKTPSIDSNNTPRVVEDEQDNSTVTTTVVVAPITSPTPLGDAELLEDLEQRERRKSGATSPIRDFRRSRSISCDIIPIVTSTTTTSIAPAAVQPAAIDDQVADDQSSTGSVEDSSTSSLDSFEEISDEEYSEDVIKDINDIENLEDLIDESLVIPDQAASSEPSEHVSSINSVEQEKTDDQIRIECTSTQNLGQLHQHSSQPPQHLPPPIPMNKVHATNNTQQPNTTPQSSPARPATASAKSTPPAKRSIGATLTRTMTKTFNTGPKQTPPKKEKEKETKQEKEKKDKLKAEKKELKKKERDLKKREREQTKGKKHITKSLSLTDLKPKTPKEAESLKVFGVRLTKLVAANNGDLPPFILSAITYLSNCDNTDVSFIFFDANNDTAVKSARSKAELEPIDFSKITSPRIVGGLLRIFFAELPQPLFNTKFYEDVLEVHEITKPDVKLHDLRAMIWSLSHLRRNLLHMFVTFLTQKYVNAATNKVNTVSILASTFGPCFFRAADPRVAAGHAVTMREDTLRLIIENGEQLFDESAGADPDIVYKTVEGKRLVAEASIERLTESATDLYYYHTDKYFSLVFFITHSYFITPNDLVDRLAALFKANSGVESETGVEVDSKKKWKKNKASRKAAVISEAVRLWVDYCYRELREDKKLAQKILKAFPHLEAALSSRLTPHRFALSDILKVPKFHTRARSLSFNETLLSSGAFSKDPSLVAMEIAEQSTLVDYELFSNVRLSDWVRLMQGAVDPSSCAHLSAALKRSSTWCSWAMGEILSVEDTKTRAAIVSLLVEVANYCRELANFNTAIAIVNALNNHHIKRLAATWALVAPETIAKLATVTSQLTVWTSLDANSFNNISASITSACVPHFATLRTVLQQLDAATPTRSADGARINADKLRSTFAIVVELQRLQQRTYNFKPSKLFMHLQELSSPSMEELAELSLKLEPPAAAKTAKRYTAPSDALPMGNWRGDIAKVISKTVAASSIGIDLPRLACFFTIAGVPSATGARLRDIQNVIISLARLVQPDDVERIDAAYLTQIPLTTPSDADIKRELIAFITEHIGNDAPVSQLLKCCTQGTIAPAVIELTLVIAKSVSFMDAAGAWRIEIVQDEQTKEVTLTHSKRQKAQSTAAKDYFEFEWQLALVLSPDCRTIISSNINIRSLVFGNETTESLRTQLTTTFQPHLLPGVDTTITPIIITTSDTNNTTTPVQTTTTETNTSLPTNNSVTQSSEPSEE